MSADRPFQPTPQAKRVLDDNVNEDAGPPLAKRQKTFDDTGHSDGWRRQPEQIRLQHDDYDVGWICALPIELAASHAMLDHIHEDLPMSERDTNAYILGSIGTHNVVMAGLPSGQYGTNNAADVASNMGRSFPSIRIRLMVGIGGGVPGIDLGDIVVGDKVTQHDLGKMNAAGIFERTATPTKPPHVLLKAVSKLRAYHERQESMVPTYLREMQQRYPKLKAYEYPRLLQYCSCRAKKLHDQRQGCDGCDNSRSSETASPKKDPIIHYGGIASGNQVIKCERTRDTLAKELGAICFEMEASGLAENFPCIVVRGICDFADSQKNKQWQKYASATAAAYAKELVSIITPSNYNNTAITHPPGISTEELQERFKNRRESLLQLLRFEQMDSRRDTIAEEHLRTCEWLLRDTVYQDWLDFSKIPQHHGFLWISGKPGAGKSTIMKFVHNRAIKRPDIYGTIASFFFNARGDSLEKSTSGLYRSLLLQLLEKFPDLEVVLDDLTLISLSPKNFPNAGVAQKLFWEAVMALGRRHLTCFIDALDECNESEIRQMIVFFEGLEEEATSNNVHLKICFSSRHYPHIDIKHGLKLTLEDQYGHGQDLQRYVESYLRVGDRAHADTFRAQILEKAAGVFMWVVLVVEILNKEFVRGRWFRVKQRLQEIPTELSELFKDILRRDNDNMDEFSLCCQWMLFAKRPLSPKEFYFAMRSGLSEGRYGPVRFNPEFDTQTDIELFVNSSSKGLAEITKALHPTVQFIHESIRDFLIKDNGLQQLWPELGRNLQVTSHEKLKECCQLYVTPNMVRLVQLPASVLCDELETIREDEARHRAVEAFPFLEYATENLLHHANISANAKSQLAFLETLSFEDWICLTNLVATDDEDCFTPTASLTYVLSDKNFTNLLEEQLRRWPVCDMEGERFGYPIFAALAKNHWAAAMVLLGRPTEPFPNEELPLDFDYETEFDPRRVHPHPLHWAIQKRLWATVRLMIDSDYYDCSKVDPRGFSSIHYIAVAGPLDILRQLMGKILASHAQSDDQTHGDISYRSEDQQLAHYIDEETKDGLKPLWYACSGLNEAAIRQFLEWGADCSAVTTRYVKFTDLSKLNSSVAQLLLEKGFASKKKLLLAAIAQGLLDMVEFIVENEAFFDEPGCRGELFLQEAVDDPPDNWREVVKLLIQKGALTGKSEWDCGKILLENAWRGDFDTVKFLGDCGVRLTDRTFASFHAASSWGHRAVVKYMIDKGVPVDLRAYERQDTALHRASANGHWPVVQLLLKRHADCDAINQNFRTPLHLAARGGYERVAKHLLAHGADVNAMDQSGQTPISLAHAAGHHDLVKIFEHPDASWFRSNPATSSSCSSCYTDSSAESEEDQSSSWDYDSASEEGADLGQMATTHTSMDDTEDSESIHYDGMPIEPGEIESTDDEE